MTKHKQHLDPATGTYQFESGLWKTTRFEKNTSAADRHRGWSLEVLRPRRIGPILLGLSMGLWFLPPGCSTTLRNGTCSRRGTTGTDRITSGSRQVASKRMNAALRAEKPQTKMTSRRRLTVDDLFSAKPLWGRPPAKAVWSWDGKRLYFSRPSPRDAKVLDLWVLENGKPRLVVAADRLLKQSVGLTEAQRAAQERRRVRSRGITDFRPDKAGKGIVLPVAGRVFYYDVARDRIRDIFPKPKGELDPRLSPNGRYLAFVRKADLWIKDLTSGRERRLTRHVKPTVTNGVAEFVAQEELARYRGFWWAPDSRSIAYTQVDESSVQVALRPKYSADGVTVVRQRYPAAGMENAKVRLGLVSVQGGPTRWIELDKSRDFYLARVRWTSRGLAYQVLSRDQRRLVLRIWDPKTKRSRTLLAETDEHYIRLHDDLRDLGDMGFVWSTENQGNRRVWLHGWNGKSVRPLSPQSMIVDKVEAATKQLVLLSVSEDRGRQRQLYALPVRGGPAVRLTRGLPWHQVSANRSATAFVDSASDLLTPPRVTIYALPKNKTGFRPSDVAKISSLDFDAPTELRKLGLARPRDVTIEAGDGTALNGLLFVPPDFDAKKRYPAVIYTYGGPGGAVALHRWRSSILWHQFLADQGFVVLLFDGRGTGHRGKSFELHLYHRFGVTDVEDVEAAVRYLRSRPFVDPGRIGLWGWSYGGFLAVMSALSKTKLLQAALAVAPVTDWRLYDTAYTERYLGMPRDHADLYQRANPVHLAVRLTIPLMLIHGMADDNVLLRHSLSLIEKLVDQGRRFEMLYFPGKRHSLKGRATRKMLLGTIADFFKRHLVASQPRGKTTSPVQTAHQ